MCLFTQQARMALFIAVFLVVFHLPGDHVLSETTIKSGNEITIPIGSRPTHLNPAIQSGIRTGIPGSQLFAFLLLTDRDWKYSPYLAESWKVSEDGMTVKFQLREGATFHDGLPITSQDVAFSILTVRDHHPFNTMLEAVDRVDTPTPLTAVVRLKHPSSVFLLAAASPMLPILPKHIYGDGQDIRTHPANWKVVGSGPFRLSSVDNERIILEKYDGFFLKGKPLLDRIIVEEADKGEQYLALESGSAHLYSFAADMAKIETLEQVEHLRINYEGYGGIGPIIWIAFNLRKPPFDDHRVRKAFAYGVDRKFLVETLFKGKARIATGPIYPGTPYYTDKVEKYSPDVEKANKLLDEAGYPRDVKGKRFSCEVLAMRGNDYLISRYILEYLRNDLYRKLGIELTIITPATFNEWSDRVANWDFTLTTDILYNWGDPSIGVHRTYSGKNIRKGVIWSNTQGYNNDEVDRLMAQAAKEGDIAKRKALYVKFQQQVVDDLPVLWLMSLPYCTIFNRDLLGLPQTVWGMMAPLNNVHWKKK